MNSGHPEHALKASSRELRSKLWALGKVMAIIIALAASLSVTIHYLNASLDAALPDPLHRSAGAAPRDEQPNAAQAQSASAPRNFSAQFPVPDGPIEPQPPTF